MQDVVTVAWRVPSSPAPAPPPLPPGGRRARRGPRRPVGDARRDPGNKHLPPKPPAVGIAHRSGEVATFSLTCDCCGERVTARDARAVV